jgi:hypothetical protein
MKNAAVPCGDFSPSKPLTAAFIDDALRGAIDTSCIASRLGAEYETRSDSGQSPWDLCTWPAAEQKVPSETKQTTQILNCSIEFDPVGLTLQMSRALR